MAEPATSEGDGSSSEIPPPKRVHVDDDATCLDEDESEKWIDDIDHEIEKDKVGMLELIHLNLIGDRIDNIIM